LHNDVYNSSIGEGLTLSTRIGSTRIGKVNEKSIHYLRKSLPKVRWDGVMFFLCSLSLVTEMIRVNTQYVKKRMSEQQVIARDASSS